MFHYLIALKRVLATDEAKSHNFYQTSCDLVEQKASGQFQFVLDSLKAKFGTKPKKFEAIRCLTKLAAATTGYNTATPLFPDYLSKTFDVLIEALNADLEGLGVPIYSSFETLIKTYPESEVCNFFISFWTRARELTFVSGYFREGRRCTESLHEDSSN
jgi:hypothetical protein